jgi:hypothetical protein
MFLFSAVHVMQTYLYRLQRQGIKVGPNSATKEKMLLLNNATNINVTAKSKRR